MWLQFPYMEVKCCTIKATFPFYRHICPGMFAQHQNYMQEEGHVEPLQNSVPPLNVVYTQACLTAICLNGAWRPFTVIISFIIQPPRRSLSPWAFARVNLSLQQNFVEGRYIVTQLHSYLLLSLLLLQCMQYCSSQFVGRQIQLVSCRYVNAVVRTYKKSLLSANRQHWKMKL